MRLARHSSRKPAHSCAKPSSHVPRRSGAKNTVSFRKRLRNARGKRVSSPRGGFPARRSARFSRVWTTSGRAISPAPGLVLCTIQPVSNTRYAKIRWFSNSAFSFRMSLSPPVSRQLRHRRAIRAEAYEREDGLWDIEACLTDQKPRDVALASGVRPNGQPIHELWLRITIDRKLNVVDAQASSDWVPYPGLCQVSNPAYRALIGLNLRQNFRRESARLLGGTAGCTHLTELCTILPTAAIQAFAGEVWSTGDSTPGANAGSGDG